jgi:hypothetical protein
MTAFFEWLRVTDVALAVRDSLMLTAGLSAIHVLGFTLVTGGAFISNLRLLGILLPGHAVAVVARPAARGIAVGLLISGLTGFLLFAPRAPEAGVNPIFRFKMLMLASAAAFHFIVHRPVSTRSAVNALAQRLVGAVGLALWASVAVAGCAYILLE